MNLIEESGKIFKPKYEKKKLIHELSNITQNINKLNLQALIDAIYVFGSVLHEEKLVHDIDLLIIYEFDSKQKKKWREFNQNLTIRLKTSLIKKYESLKEKYSSILKKFRFKLLELKLNEKEILIKSKELRKELKIPQFHKFIIEDLETQELIKNSDLEIDWLKCLNWKIIKNVENNINIEIILKRILLKEKNEKFDFFFAKKEDFLEGIIPKLYSLKINYLLAWNEDHPDVIENLDSIPILKKKDYAIKELNNFLEDIELYCKNNEQSTKKIKQLKACKY